MSVRAWALLVGLLLAALVAASIVLWLTRATTSVLRSRMRAWGRRTVRDFQSRIARYKLVSRRAIRDELILDPVVVAAMRAHMKETGHTEVQARAAVEEYIDEILPFFNVLSYYKIGYNVSKLVLSLLYKVSVDYQDEESLERIPKNDVVVYLMNHRSNADYVVLAYVLAHGVAVSYAVGEWARVWPLETVFKSFGSYFVRRRFREPLYHAVLERYIQLITKNRVTQAIFLEGGLSRDGRFRPAKIGLLDYIAGTLREEGFDRDIWFVPVAINYDRTLEDRSLIRECLHEDLREPRLRQLLTVTQYLAFTAVRLLARRVRRQGRAAVNFGTPVSLRTWMGAQPRDVLRLPRDERLPEIQRLADRLLERIKAVVPVTPVALASAALLSFELESVPLAEVLERIDDYRDHLLEANAKVVRADRTPEDVWERAMMMFRIRHTVHVEAERVIVISRQRPLLEYYANSIRHLLPHGALPGGQLLSPAHDVLAIEEKFRLKPWTPIFRP
ncbi:MAG: 1-acyl-sn-glycerol-3-phosphate acyltransferase [Gemmatimonadales bacterium]